MVRFVFAVFGPIVAVLLLALPVLSPASAQATTYRDAAEYCRAVGTVDYPEAPYVGEAVPRWILAAVRARPIPDISPSQDVEEITSWRCMNARVLACVDPYGMAHLCDQYEAATRPNELMIEFCSQPQTRNTNIPMAVWRLSVHSWRCVSGRPTIERRGPAEGVLDDRLFVREGWFEVTTSTSPVRDSQTYRDAAEYCRAVGTVDEPGHPYVGPEIPAWIQTSGDNIRRQWTDSETYHDFRWRCAVGRVLLCMRPPDSYGECYRWSDTRVATGDMRETCRRQPNRDGFAAGYEHHSVHVWRCVNGRPVIARLGPELGVMDDRLFIRNDWTDITDQAPPPPPVWPLPESNGSFESLITSNYGAHGPGPATNPNTYLAGQYHPALDISAEAGDEVVAPVDGTIIYYHRLRNSPPEERWVDTFIVLRASDGRDWILGHVDCSVCSAMPVIGDSGVIETSQHVTVTRGRPIGVVAPLRQEAIEKGSSSLIGDHLHLSIVITQVIDAEGRLNLYFRGGQWAFLRYSDERRGPPAAAASATSRGFIDPTPVLREALAEHLAVTVEAAASDQILYGPVRVRVQRQANVRSVPSATGNRPVGSVAVGAILDGEWVSGTDGQSRWLRMRSENGVDYVYVWGANLVEVRRDINDSLGAGTLG